MSTEVKQNNNKNLLENLLYYQNTVDPAVKGWFYLYDNAVIHEILKVVQKDIPGDLCEIGVAFGKSAVAFSNYKRKDDTLYLYEIEPGHKINGENNINKYGTNENIEWRIHDTTTLKEEEIRFSRPLRFLHIDGWHEHAAVLSDFTLFSKKLADNGVIALDDYNDMEYPGVNSGCMHFLFSNREWLIFAIGQNKAYLCKRSYYQFYIKSLLTTLDEQNKKYNLQLKFNLRQVFDANVLLCCSRIENTKEKILSSLLSDLRPCPAPLN